MLHKAHIVVKKGETIGVFLFLFVFLFINRILIFKQKVLPFLTQNWIKIKSYNSIYYSWNIHPIHLFFIHKFNTVRQMYTKYAVYPQIILIWKDLHTLSKYIFTAEQIFYICRSCSFIIRKINVEHLQ